MLQRMFFGLLLIVFWQGVAAAEVRSSMEDKMVGAAVKSLAKAYVATADIEKLKKKNIDKLKNMDNSWFKNKYEESYETLKDLPPKLKDRYGIRETMTKEQAIVAISSIDKKRLYEEIDMVPDAMIVEQVKLHLNKDAPEAKQENLLEKVGEVWNQVVSKMDREDK